MLPNNLLPKSWDLQPYLQINLSSPTYHKLRSRKCLITCSDYASAINCFDAYKSRKKLYGIKIGSVQEKENHYSQLIMDHGNRMEVVALNHLMENWELLLLRPSFFLDLQNPRLGGSPDGILVSLKPNHSIYLLEIKCPAEAGLPEGISEVKMRYIIQIMGLLHATQLRQGILMYYVAPLEPKYFVITFDREMWEEISEKLEEFISFLEKKISPPSPSKKTFKDFNISKFVKEISIKDI
jgi:hypothetical protein